MNNKPTATLDDIIRRLDSGDHWSLSVLGYDFVSQPPVEGFAGNEQLGLSFLSNEQQYAVHRAMESWDDLIPMSLSYMPDSNADILLSNYAYTYVAYAYLPPDGDIFINPDTESNQKLDYGDYGYSTLVHEIGHALGLNHPGAYDSMTGYRFDYASQADYQQDSLQYTVMSYWEAENTGAQHQGRFPSTPLLHDIAAIQVMYGVNTQIRSGDSVYGFNSNTKDVYDFTLNNQPVLCLWDPEGMDTLDLSDYLMDNFANLNPGTFSDIGGLQKNLSIAFNTQIENLIGGSGNDVLIGQEADNQIIGGVGDDALEGNMGDDWLIGGSGVDVALYNVTPDLCTLTYLNPARYQIVGPEGTDLLEFIEWLQFADGSLVYLNPIATMPEQVSRPEFDSISSILNLPQVLTTDHNVLTQVSLYLNFSDTQMQLHQLSENVFSNPAVSNDNWPLYDLATGVLTIPDVRVDGQSNFKHVQIHLDWTEQRFHILQAIPMPVDTEMNPAIETTGLSDISVATDCI